MEIKYVHKAQCGGGVVWNYDKRVYPKVSGLAAWRTANGTAVCH
jgi:hypothetical protein